MYIYIYIYIYIYMGGGCCPTGRYRRGHEEATRLARIAVKSTEGISEIWVREAFPRWGFLRFRVRVGFTYG